MADNRNQNRDSDEHSAESQVSVESRRQDLEMTPTTPITPLSTDVLLGRGRGYTRHPGNQCYQQTISRDSAQYEAARSNLVKTRITKAIVDSVRETGRFLEFDTTAGHWYEIDDEKARRKVAQDIRNHLRTPQGQSQEPESPPAPASAVAAAAIAAAPPPWSLGAVGTAPTTRSSWSNAFVPAHQQYIATSNQEPLLSDEDIISATLAARNNCSGDHNDDVSVGSQQLALDVLAEAGLTEMEIFDYDDDEDRMMGY